jgi:hypothetical protein
MSDRGIALIVLACVFASALVGLTLRSVLPKHHLGDDTKHLVTLGNGFIGTLTALVLGLLVSSADESFRRVSNELTSVSVKVVELDRMLREYGPEAAAVRDLLTRGYGGVVEIIASGDPAQRAKLVKPSTMTLSERIVAAIQQLSPRNGAQRVLQSRALALANEALGSRWLLVLQADEALSTPILVVLVSWLCVIFVSWGLFAARNATAVAALFIFALCTSAAILLILELNSPLDGWVTVSDKPMRMAMAQLGQ